MKPNFQIRQVYDETDEVNLKEFQKLEEKINKKD